MKTCISIPDVELTTVDNKGPFEVKLQMATLYWTDEYGQVIAKLDGMTWSLN